MKSTSSVKSKFALLLSSTTKTVIACVLGLGMAPDFGWSQSAIIDRGPDHQRWQAVTSIEDNAGGLTATTNQWIEIASGLNRWDSAGGQWVNSKAEFRALAGRFVVQEASFQLSLGETPVAKNAVDMVLPDGGRISSHVFAVQLWDAAGNQGLTIATPKDVVGKLAAPNRVVYESAFDGIDADLEYVVGLDGVHQNVVIRGAIPDAQKAGLDPETTRIEVWTEILEAPGFTLNPMVLRQEADPVVRAQMAEPDWVDDGIDFGSMQMPMGAAWISKPNAADRTPLLLAKRLVQIGTPARTFLIEQTPYQQAALSLVQNELPPRIRHLASGAGNPAVIAGLNSLSHSGRETPQPLSLEAIYSFRDSMALADIGRRAGSESKGLMEPRDVLVLDYQALSTTSDFTFNGTTTY